MSIDDNQELTAENEAMREQLRWRKCEDKPPPGLNVLIRYTNALNKTRTVRGCWFPQWFNESNGDEYTEYYEETDEFYTPEGWYEAVETDIGMDYTSWLMECQTPRAWLPIPQDNGSDV